MGCPPMKRAGRPVTASLLDKDRTRRGCLHPQGSFFSARVGGEASDIRSRNGKEVLFEGKRVGNRILDWWGLSMPCSPGRRGQFGDALNRSISQTGQHVAEIIADWDLESAAAFDYR